MGTFMDSNKRVVAKSITGNVALQLAVPTTLSFYIVERAQNTALTDIMYQVEQVSGRSSTVLTAWTAISMVGITDSIYSFDYTLAALTAGSTITLRFKTVDADSQEAFIYMQDVVVVS